MTVTDISPIVEYVYTDEGPYSFTFKAFKESTIKAEHISSLGVITPLVYTTDYSVSLDGDNGGSITLEDSATVQGLSSGILYISRELEFVQETEWPNNNPFSAKLLESDLDKLTMLMQQLRAIVTGALVTTTWRSAWVTGGEYSVQDIVYVTDEGNNMYLCIEDHTAGVFADDLAAGKWLILIDLSDANDILAAEANAIAAAENASNCSASAFQSASDAEAAKDTAISAKNAAQSIAISLTALYNRFTTVHIITSMTPALSGADGYLQTWALTANANPTDGFAEGEFIRLTINDGVGPYTINWPGVVWLNNGGVAPDLTASTAYVVDLWKIDTTLFGLALSET